jgi:rfaE bifunctional protein kinase chain/domain
MSVYEPVAAFPDCRILVVGDAMLDCAIRGSVARISPEAPVPVLDYVETTYTPGGAANVAMNVRALGAKAVLAAVVGDDEEGERLISLLRDKGIELDALAVDAGRPTTTKTRVIAQGQHMLRIDRERRDPPAAAVLRDLGDALLARLSEVDAVIISDYGKGVLEPWLLKRVLIESRRRGVPTVVDPSGSDARRYAGATALTPNLREAIELGGGAPLEGAICVIVERTQCTAVLVTLGAGGMTLFESGAETTVPAAVHEAFDCTGAGDTVAAVFTLALASGAPTRRCAELANCGAGVVVQRVGAATLTLAELAAAAGVPPVDGVLPPAVAEAHA